MRIVVAVVALGALFGVASCSDGSSDVTAPPTTPSAWEYAQSEDALRGVWTTTARTLALPSEGFNRAPYLYVRSDSNGVTSAWIEGLPCSFSKPVLIRLDDGPIETLGCKRGPPSNDVLQNLWGEIEITAEIAGRIKHSRQVVVESDRSRQRVFVTHGLRM